MTMGHFRKGTPTAGLEVIMEMIPLKFQLQRQATEAYLRTMDYDSSTQVKSSERGHLQQAKEHLAAGGIMHEKTDKIAERMEWGKGYKVDLGSFDGKSPPMDDGFKYNIYTDGSRFMGKVGSGLVVYEHGNIIHKSNFTLNESSTVYQAEVYAIKKAAEWIQRRTFWSKCLIHVDNQAALQALDMASITKESVLKTREALNEAHRVRRTRITLRWIKAHAGHEGNEIADEQAKEGTTKGEILDDAPKLPLATRKKAIKELFHQKWNEYWMARKDCRQTKHWFPGLNKDNRTRVATVTRDIAGVLVQLITGHNYLKRHEAIVNGTDDNECERCGEGEEESSLHVIGECPAYGRIRRERFGSHCLSPPLSWSVKQVLGFLREASIELLPGPEG